VLGFCESFNYVGKIRRAEEQKAKRLGGFTADKNSINQ
jgi:hypothetical protein